MQLIKSYSHRWGKGTVHMSWIGEKNYIPRCRYPNDHTPLSSIHGEYIEGTAADLTCKNCIRIYFKINPSNAEKLF